MNSKEFSLIIEDIVKKHKELSYVDAIVKYCDENNIEIETTARLITKQLKEKNTTSISTIKPVKRW